MSAHSKKMGVLGPLQKVRAKRTAWKVKEGMEKKAPLHLGLLPDSRLTRGP